MECSTIPARLIATCFALVAFAAATVVGLAAGNETYTILKRAICTMLCCWVVGWVVGRIAQRVVQDHIEAYKAANPIPNDDEPAEATMPTGEGEQVEKIA